MNEDELSQGLYLASRDDPDVVVLSWQGVSGKAYFTADIQLRLPGGERVAPDLIILYKSWIWIIEVKSTHEESLAQDEPKLELLVEARSADEILDQIRRRTRLALEGCSLKYAVAFGPLPVSQDGCRGWIAHIPWNSYEGDLIARRVGRVLDALAWPK